MTKSEFVGKVAENANSSKVAVETVLTSFTKVLTESVKKGEKITLPGLGTFEKVRRKARVGVNPATGAKVNIAAKDAPKFKASKTFKDAVA